MSGKVYESGNRRTEIIGNTVSFLRVTGHVRRSLESEWFMECPDLKRARRLAKRWAFDGKLGKPVLH
jgi:hypothetical protein